MKKSEKTCNKMLISNFFKYPQRKAKAQMASQVNSSKH